MAQLPLFSGANDPAALRSYLNQIVNQLNSGSLELLGDIEIGGSLTVDGPLLGKSAIAFSGAQTSAKSMFWYSGLSLSGTPTAPTSGVIAPFQIYVGSDAATPASGLVHLGVTAAASAGRTGTRTGVQGYVQAVGAPASGDWGVVGVTGIVRIAVNQGGATGAYTNYKGSGFGGNSNVFTSPAGSATFLKLINAHEFNVTLASTASAADKYGISIVKAADDATRGTYDDCAISIQDQDSASVGWAVGLQFGAYAHQWAFDVDSTLIGVKERVAPNPVTSPALYGIDMSALTITAGGAGIVMPLITPASAAATGKAGSIVWDTGFIYVCTGTDTWKRVAIATW